MATRLTTADTSVVDALVGFTAGLAGAVLRTRDPRALRTYELLGIEIEQVGS